MGQHLEQAGEQVGADVADLRDRRHRQLAALDDLVRQAHALCGTRTIQLVGNMSGKVRTNWLQRSYKWLTQFPLPHLEADALVCTINRHLW